MPVNFDNLTLRSRKPLTLERIERYVGTDCGILNEDRTPYLPYVIVAAEPTDDPYLATIQVERKRVWRLPR